MEKFFGIGRDDSNFRWIWPKFGKKFFSKPNPNQKSSISSTATLQKRSFSLSIEFIPRVTQNEMSDDVTEHLCKIKKTHSTTKQKKDCIDIKLDNLQKVYFHIQREQKIHFCLSLNNAISSFREGKKIRNSPSKKNEMK